GDDARQAALLGRGGAARAACHQNRHNEHGERQERRNPSRAYHQDSFVIETLYQLDAGIIARVALRWRGRRGGQPLVPAPTLRVSAPLLPLCGRRGSHAEFTRLLWERAARPPGGLACTLPHERHAPPELQQSGEQVRRAAVKGERGFTAADLPGGAIPDNGLRLGELADAIRPVTPPDAALLETAHRRVHHRPAHVAVVNSDRACLEPGRRHHAPARVACRNDVIQAVAAVVHLLDGLLHRLDTVDGEHRSERLLAIGQHPLAHAGQHSRLVEVWPDVRAGAAPGKDRCALCDRILYVLLDGTKLRLADQRADVRVIAGGAAQPAAAYLRQQFFEERLINFLDDVQPLNGDTHLPGVVECRFDGDVRGVLQVGVCQHDHRVLAARLHAGRDEPPCRALGYPPPDFRAAC